MGDHNRDDSSRLNLNVTREDADPTEIKPSPGSKRKLCLYKNLAAGSEPDAIAIHFVSRRQRTTARGAHRGIRERRVFIPLDEDAKLLLCRPDECKQAGSMSLS